MDLTDRQKQMAEFAEWYEINCGDVASREVLARRFGVSVKTVCRELKALREAGVISEGMYKMRPGDSLTRNEEKRLAEWWDWSDEAGRILTLPEIAHKWGLTTRKALTLIGRFIKAGCVRMTPRQGFRGRFYPSRGSWYELLKNPLNPNEWRTWTHYRGLGASKRCIKKKPKPTPPAESNPP